MVLSNKILARTFLASAVSLTATIGFSNLALAQISEQYFVRKTVIDSSHPIPVDSFSSPPALDDAFAIDDSSDLVDRPPLSIATSDSDSFFDATINTFIGNLEVAGLAKVYLPGPGVAIAESDAVTNFQRIGANPQSTIKVQDFIMAVGLGDARGGEARDSISFVVEDLDTGDTLLEGTFLDIYANLQGTLELDDVVSFTGVNEGIFRINLDNPFINTTGTLLAEFKNGILTTSNDSGIFDGLLPSVGSVGTFSFSLPNIEFSYDLPDFGEDVLFSLDSRVSGSAIVVVPEPSITLGVLSFGIINVFFRLKRKS